MTVPVRNLASFEGPRPSIVKLSPFETLMSGSLSQRSFKGLVVKAAAVVAPKFTSVKPLGDRVLVKIKEAEEKTEGGIFLPTTAQSKPQGGEVVAVGEGKTIGKTKLESSVKIGAQVIYSKYAGTEVEFNGLNHLILKEDDIVGILETDDNKDLKPLNDSFHQGCRSRGENCWRFVVDRGKQRKTSTGTVIAVGPGALDEEGNRKPLSVVPGNTVLYSKYAGNDLKGNDGTNYITLKASDVMAVLS